MFCFKNFIPHIAETFKLKEQVEIDKYISNTFTLEKDARECKQQIEHAFKSIDNLVKLGIVKDEKNLYVLVLLVEMLIFETTKLSLFIN